MNSSLLKRGLVVALVLAGLCLCVFYGVSQMKSAAKKADLLERMENLHYEARGIGFNNPDMLARLTDGIGECSEMLEENPNDEKMRRTLTGLYVDRCQLHARLGKLPEALSDIEKVIDSYKLMKDSAYGAACEYRASLLRKSNRWQDAMDAYKQLIAEGKESHHTYRALIAMTKNAPNVADRDLKAIEEYRRKGIAMVGNDWQERDDD